MPTVLVEELTLMEVDELLEIDVALLLMLVEMDMETEVDELLEIDVALLLLLVEMDMETEVEVEVEGPMLMEEDELLPLVVLLDIVQLASRYQFAGGSPRHSPTVTGL
jgi:hypothetical protein